MAQPGKIWLSQEKNLDKENVRRDKIRDPELKSWRRSEMEKLKRKKMLLREKIGKSQNNVFFQYFLAREGRKVGVLRRRVWR